MWIFERGLYVTDVKKYIKQLGKAPICSITESMAMNYLKSCSRDKFLIKYRIQDILNEIEKSTILSIIISLITVILNNIYKDWIPEIMPRYVPEGITGTFFIMYVIVTIYFIDMVRYYRICKLYLGIIKDIEEGKIELGSDSDNNDYIKFKK